MTTSKYTASLLTVYENKSLFFQSWILSASLSLQRAVQMTNRLQNWWNMILLRNILLLSLLRYIQEWLNSMVAAGIVTSHADDRFSLDYPESELKTHGHGATILPILSAMLPKLEAVLPSKGPKGELFVNIYFPSTLCQLTRRLKLLNYFNNSSFN